MLNHCHGRGLTLADQRALSDQSAANAAADGRGDRRVAQVDARGLHCGAGHGHIGLSELLGGLRIDKFLLTDGFGFEQRFEALGLGTGLHQIGFGFSHTGLRTGQCGLIRTGVNLKQRLASAHAAALCEKALLHDARSTGAHLRHTRGFQPSGQFRDQAHIAGLDRNHTHLSGWRCATWATRGGCGNVALATGRQQQGQPQCTGCPDSTERGGSVKVWTGRGYAEVQHGEFLEKKESPAEDTRRVNKHV